MHKILLFGGTTEGRRLWEYFSRTDAFITISVATGYGEALIAPHERGNVISGRLDAKEMTDLMKKGQFSVVIDATHPYAVDATKNIKTAAEGLNILYLRVKRNQEMAETDNLIEVYSMEEAVAYLKQTTGSIFVTTGSKELLCCQRDSSFLSRLTVRVLPDSSVIHQCLALGLKGSQIIAMQGPFSEELNVSMLKHTGAAYLLTKASGDAGGFSEKVRAAQKVSARIVVIGQKINDEGLLEGELIETISKKLSLHVKRQVSFVGIGMGRETLTGEARHAILSADIIIGAKRLLKELEYFHKKMVPYVLAQDIAGFIANNPQYQNPVVVFSGDVGFYSGANKLYSLLQDFDIKTISGISSPVYFLDKLGIGWQDTALSSLHGNTQLDIGNVFYHSKSFYLLGKAEDVPMVCRKLCDMGMGGLEIAVGEWLSYPQERIVTGKAEEFLDKCFDPLSVMLVKNPNPWKQRPQGIPDNAFSRTNKIPMTKREVRAVTLSVLGICSHDIFYDIGAGTGSISIEGAFCCPHGQVFAVEQNEEAVKILYENRKNFNCGNINVVKGQAPEAFQELPSPDKVFIGGSGGRLFEILTTVLEKNPYALIVINSIALETLTSILQLFQKLGIVTLEIIQVSISKGEKTGGYHLMKGQNPIFIISGRGSGK